ncbi:MAG: MaoC family dehydratase [Hyphomicrobiales bacterium]|nr:MaoC family dehydratase [Hyphomicrobiales bacterium]
MKQLGHGFYWQDLTVGERYRTWGRTITETDIIGFVNTVGMHEPLFTDAEYRRTQSAMTGFAAPGSLVFCIAEGLVLAGTAHGTGLAFLHTELDIKGPVLAGDTIHVEIEVTEVRPTSKGRGLVRTRNEIRNQRGELVVLYTPLRLMRGRPE